MAILDYIQRCHPSDTDTYKMVSLYFTMYREIAAMLEDNANRQIQQLKAKSLGQYFNIVVARGQYFMKLTAPGQCFDECIALGQYFSELTALRL